MSHWDVFHSDRLQVERGLTTEEVRAALAEGALRDDDLIRPSGTSAPWGRLADLAELAEPPTQASPTASTVFEDLADRPTAPLSLGSTYIPPSTTEDIGADPLGPDAIEDLGIEALIDDDDDDELTRFRVDGASIDESRRSTGSVEALPVGAAEEIVEAEIADDDEEEEEDDPITEDEAAAEFTLSRRGAETIEELDLAAMVDVAFQLVLFFLVTASTLVFKTLEVPAPKPEDASAAASQGSKTPEDLMDTFILVEVDPAGSIKVDHEPAPADMRALSDRLRAARSATGRLKMLLMADATTPHRSAVLAYDAANEVGLGIAIARPTGAK